MSDYFNKFSRVDYIFGDEYFAKGGGDTALELMQNLTSYVEVIDSVKQNASFYSKYQILEGDRPDQVSQKIYGTPNYHWTFYIMNDNLRASGWPLTNNELERKYKRDFPHQFIQTTSDLTSVFTVDQIVVGSQSGTAGRCLRRYLDNGVLIVNTTSSYTAGETVNNVTAAELKTGQRTGLPESATVVATGDEYNAPYYYIDASKNRVDIDPSVGPGAQLTPITFADYYIEQNDALKLINVIRPDAINEIVNTYFQALGTA